MLVVDPGVAGEVVEVELVVVAHLLVVVDVSVAADDRHVVADDGGGVEGAVLGDTGARCRVMEARPVPVSDVERVQRARPLRELGVVGQEAAEDDDGA